MKRNAPLGSVVLSQEEAEERVLRFSLRLRDGLRARRGVSSQAHTRIRGEREADSYLWQELERLVDELEQARHPPWSSDTADGRRLGDGELALVKRDHLAKVSQELSACKSTTRYRSVCDLSVSRTEEDVPLALAMAFADDSARLSQEVGLRSGRLSAQARYWLIWVPSGAARAAPRDDSATRGAPSKAMAVKIESTNDLRVMASNWRGAEGRRMVRNGALQSHMGRGGDARHSLQSFRRRWTC